MTVEDKLTPKPRRQMKVEIPSNLDGTYSNLAFISHSSSEIVIDYARVLPNVPKARVQVRIIMTPMNAKLLHRALSDNLTKFEVQHGEIDLPVDASLADQLFRAPPDPEGEK